MSLHPQRDRERVQRVILDALHGLEGIPVSFDRLCVLVATALQLQHSGAAPRQYFSGEWRFRSVVKVACQVLSQQKRIHFTPSKLDDVRGWKYGPPPPKLRRSWPTANPSNRSPASFQ
jgi:hypothetical protein